MLSPQLGRRPCHVTVCRDDLDLETIDEPVDQIATPPAQRVNHDLGVRAGSHRHGVPALNRGLELDHRPSVMRIRLREESDGSAGIEG